MSKTGRNDPCPCGSGIKYKNCCINNFSINLSGDTFDVITYFKEYNPVDLLLWFQTILAHPNNSTFLIRLEYLIALLLSIPKNSFKNNLLKYENVKYFFDNTDKEYSKKFMIYEDFKGFNQNKLIPIIFEGERFYFFYGGLERPYEYYKKIPEIYFKNQTNSEFLEFKDLFVKSLEFQTQLLNKIISLKESLIDEENIYIPSQSYFNQVSPLFKAKAQTNSKIRFGFLNGLKPNEILNKCINAEIYNDILVTDGEEGCCFLYPQIHINVFLNTGKRILKNNKELENTVIRNFKNRILEQCTKFFTMPKYIPEILEPGSNKNLIENNIDFACLVDGNKLFLFGGVDFSMDEDISDILSEFVDKLIAIKQSILSNDFVGIVDIGEKNTYGIYTKEIEIFCFPVYEALTFNTIGGIMRKENDSNTYPISFIDLKAVFERIGKPMDFLKFLREDFRLIEMNQYPFMGEFMDRFSFYISNGKSYSRTGRKIDMMMFVPHIWHTHIMDELYEKYKDSVFEVIEKKFPDCFNVIENYSNNVYRMLNTADLQGAYLTRWKSRDIWIYPPLDGYNLDSDDVRIGYDMLMPLFADYLCKLENELLNIFDSAGTLKNIEYSLFVFPKSFIEKRQEFDYLKPLLNELNENNPIIFKTLRYYDGKIRTSIIFEKNFMHYLFGKAINSGERYCIKELIKSILKYLGINNSDAEKTALEFINKHIAEDLKGYSLELLPTINPELNKYHSAIEFNDTDISIINRKISEYLIKNNYSPCTLEGKEAKDLNYKIYCFLQNLLETEIKDFNQHILYYAYRQLELNEGYRAKERVRKGMQAKGKVKYDVLEKLIEDEKLDSQLSMSIKHILHTILKCNPVGNMTITSEKWSYLLAISTIILETAMIYDFIQYDIKKHSLKISQDFLIEDIEGDEVMDSLSYFKDNIKNRLESAKKIHSKVFELNEEPKFENVQPMPEDLLEIDNAFKQELGFRYENLLFILLALHRLNLFNKDKFPLTLTTLDEIKNELRKADRLNIDDIEITRIIEFLSLSDNSYKDDTCLIPSEMMRDKERINVSPFIKLNNGMILYGNEVVNNSSKFWSRIIYGEFPYQLPKNSLIQKALDSIHRNIDLDLEKDVEQRAIKVLGEENVESRISNFKRLSQNFSRNESCGEIDLLCINKTTSTIFILDAKNINIRVSLYHMRKNIDEFYNGDKSYYSKLMKKKKFIEDNKTEILRYFKITKHENWRVIEGFVTTSYLFAKYFKELKVSFVLLEELDDFLMQAQVGE